MLKMQKRDKNRKGKNVLTSVISATLHKGSNCCRNVIKISWVLGGCSGNTLVN